MLIQPTEEAKATLANTGGGAINNALAQAAIWAWYNSNPDRLIVKVAFIRVRVKDLRILFEILAGPER